MGGRCCNGWSRRCCNGWAEGVATNARGQMQQMGEVGGYCNGWSEGVATNGRGGTGQMQQDIAIFHSGWTTVNDATAIYGSYRKCCNKVPCTLRNPTHHVNICRPKISHQRRLLLCVQQAGLKACKRPRAFGLRPPYQSCMDNALESQGAT